VDSRTSADRSGDGVGSWDADKPSHGFCDRLDVALLAVRRDDVFHDDVSDCGVASADHPSVIDTRHAHGGRWLGIEGLQLATQSWVNASASVTFAPYLTHATIAPLGPLRRGIPRSRYPSCRHMASISSLARREIGVREKTGGGCRHGS